MEQGKEKTPPIGIAPRYIINSRRISEIKAAINRYIEAKHKIPIEWIEEYNERILQKY